MRGKLLRAISHDLRTPLTGILGASGALLDNGDLIDPESRRSLISGIHEDAEWLLRMVENVLSVTRITGGALSLKKVCEPLDEVFSQVAAKSRKRFPDIDLTMRMPDEVAMVPMDEMLIVQVLVNLIDNAIRHSGSNRVELSAETEGDHVRMVVRDHGRGIPPWKICPRSLKGLVRATGNPAIPRAVSESGFPSAVPLSKDMAAISSRAICRTAVRASALLCLSRRLLLMPNPEKSWSLRTK